MKKILLSALTLCSAIAFVACDKAGNEYHGTTIATRDGSGLVQMYADQTTDSIFVLSYDSWTASPEYLSGGEWCQFSDLKCNVPAGYYVTQTVIIETTPNTTGVSRGTAYKIRSEWPELGEVALYVYQYGWLNITVPLPTFSSQDIKEAKPVFAHELSAAATKAPLAFYVFGDATIESDAEWLTIPQSVKMVEPGSHGVELVVTPNNTNNAREAHVTLTSNGVSNVITYTQKRAE